MGNESIKEVKYDIKVHSVIAERWSHILSKGLENDIKKELIESYPAPDNLKTLKEPSLNLEIIASLN